MGQNSPHAFVRDQSTRSVSVSFPQQSSWALEGASWGWNAWQCGAPVTVQSTWTPDIHASAPEQESR